MGFASFSSKDLTYLTHWYKRGSNLLLYTSSNSIITETTSLLAIPISNFNRLYVVVRLFHLILTRYDNRRIIRNLGNRKRNNYDNDTTCRPFNHSPSVGDDALYVPHPPTSARLDLLQVAALAAGIADNNDSTTYSVDSPSPPPQSAPSTPISSPNCQLLVPSTSRSMPKNKNKGAAGDTPTKSPRTGGRALSATTCHRSLLTITRLSKARIMNETSIAPAKTYSIHLTVLTLSYVCIATPEDDILDMSGIQEGLGSDHSSDLNSTIQKDPPPTDDSQVPPAGSDGKSYGPRQSSPNQDTPRSSHPEDESDKESKGTSSSKSNVFICHLSNNFDKFLR